MEILLTVTTWRVCYWTLKVEPRDATKCPTMHGTAPHNKDHLAQNVSNAEAEKLCLTLTDSQVD